MPFVQRSSRNWPVMRTIDIVESEYALAIEKARQAKTRFLAAERRSLAAGEPQPLRSKANIATTEALELARICIGLERELQALKEKAC